MIVDMTCAVGLNKDHNFVFKSNVECEIRKMALKIESDIILPDHEDIDIRLLMCFIPSGRTIEDHTFYQAAKSFNDTISERSDSSVTGMNIHDTSIRSGSYKMHSKKDTKKVCFAFILRPMISVRDAEHHPPNFSAPQPARRLYIHRLRRHPTERSCAMGPSCMHRVALTVFEGYDVKKLKSVP